MICLQFVSSTIMKLLSTTLVSVSALFALTVNAVQAARELTPEDPAPFFFTLNVAADAGDGCIGLKQGTTEHGDRLVLRSCESDDDSILWTIDGDSRFRSKVNMTQCMQVGVKDSPAAADSPLRMVECGRTDALQQFDLSDFMSDLSGLIKVASAPHLCVVHHGPGTQIDKDIIFLKKCEILGEDRSQGWEVNFHQQVPDEEPSDFFTFGAPGGDGCIGLKNGSILRGTPLILVNCSLTDDAIQWVKDYDHRFHSKVDFDMCIQVGVTGSTPESGTSMRIVPCGVSDLQHFDITQVGPIEGGLGGPIKPEGSADLCMVHRGNTANIGEDPILVKPCSSLIETGDERSKGWIITFLSPNPV
jgi:hypothetical protein